MIGKKIVFDLRFFFFWIMLYCLFVFSIFWDNVVCCWYEFLGYYDNFFVDCVCDWFFVKLYIVIDVLSCCWILIFYKFMYLYVIFIVLSMYIFS